MRKLISLLVHILAALHKLLHLLRIIVDLAVNLISLVIREAKTIELVSVCIVHEVLLVFDIEGKLMLESDVGIVDLCVVDLLVVVYLLVLVFHALEGFVDLDLVLVREIEDFVLD
jgi:hypothetical protein